MKDKFKGYYKLTENQIKSIWAKGFISIDANVLLNLYRYSDDTRNELLLKMEKYSTRLWLTYHATYEFQKNRVGVISDQIKIYEDTIKEFDKLEDNIIRNLKSPHLSRPIEKIFKKNISAIRRDLEKRKQFYLKLLKNDTILNKVTKLFTKKVGDQFSKEDISKIEKEGEERYKKNIPPGYKDKDKPDNKFGDLIIWKELLKKAKDENRPFIFIGDDTKEDWWLKAKGITLSPRNELSQELYIESKQIFYIYTPDRFLEFASKGRTANKEAIQEVKNVQQGVYLNSLPIIESAFFHDPQSQYSQSTQEYFKGQPFNIYGQINPNFQSYAHSIPQPFLTTIPGTIYSPPGGIFTSNDFFSQTGNFSAKQLIDEAATIKVDKIEGKGT